MRYLEQSEVNRRAAEILFAFADFCEEKQFPYYIAYGTLIGAVRHEGYIPWDDDIDVIMKRDTYEAFLQAWEEEAPVSYYEISFYRNDEASISPFARIVDRRTDGNEEHLRKDIHNGCWIDIFPLDYVPDDAAERNAFFQKQIALSKRLDRSTRRFRRSSNPLKLLKRIVLYLVAWKDRHKNLAEQLDQGGLAMNARGGRALCLTVTHGDMPHGCFVDEDFEPAIRLPFEGRLLRAPGNTDTCLRKIYGDYMTLPPESERVNKHEYKAWLL